MTDADLAAIEALAGATWDEFQRTDVRGALRSLCAEVRRLQADNERMRRGIAAIGNLPKGYEDKIWDGCANLLAGREWSNSADGAEGESK